jgi:PAS domain S-box-containing protein
VNVPFEFSKPLRWARQKAANPSVIWQYGIAVTAVLAATEVRLALNAVLGVPTPYGTFALAVIVSAWLGGRGPGLVATALSAFSLAWFFLKPLHSLAIANPEEMWGLAIFVVASGLIALLVGSLRESFLARARAEETLQQQTQLINLSHDAVITMDAQRRIITWNTGAEEMYGWPEQDAIGKGFHQLLQTISQIPLTAIDEILNRERRWEGELIYTARDGRRLVVDSRQVMIGGGNGLPARILAIMLRNSSGGEQDMVVSGVRGIDLGGGLIRLASRISLTGSSPVVVFLSAFCAAFEKDNPSPSATFSVDAPDPTLACITRRAANLSVAAKQAAVWMYTDRLSYGHMSQKFRVSASEWSAAQSVAAACGVSP